MATRYMVRVASSTTDASGHGSTVRCTCGWSTLVSAPTSVETIQRASEARADHIADAHPGQVIRTGPVVATGHELTIGAPTKQDHLWTRHAVCGCTWTATVSERTPDRVATALRARHRDHLIHETGRAPLRDYVVMAALVAVVAVVMLLLFTTVVDVSAR